MDSQSSWIRFVWMSLLAIGTTALSVGCSPYTTHTHYDIRQSAYVQTPRGPATTGSVMQKEKLALEGSLSGTHTESEDATRVEGAPGHVALDRGLDTRLLIGATEHLEFGVGGSFGHSQFSTPVASDAGAFGDTSILAGSLDTHLRVKLMEGESVQLYGLGEMHASIIPYRRHVDVYQRTTYYPEYEEGDRWRLEHQQERSDFNNRLVLLPAGGLGATFGMTNNTFLSAGLYGQDVPVFFGRQVTRTTCHNATGDVGDEECTGREPDDVKPLRHSFVGTLYGGFGVELGDTSLRLQAFYNAVAGSTWNEHSPAGGRLAVRHQF